MIGCNKQDATNFFEEIGGWAYTQVEDVPDFYWPNRQSFSDSAIPSAANKPHTINLNASATPITSFAGAHDGQEWLVYFNGIVTVDLSTNAALVGNAGVDFVSAQDDGMFCRHYNGITYCIPIVK